MWAKHPACPALGQGWAGNTDKMEHAGGGMSFKDYARLLEEGGNGSNPKDRL